MTFTTVLFSIIFSLVAITHLVACAMQPNMELLRFITKPLCIPLLILIFVLLMRKKNIKTKYVILFSVAFCLHTLGDIFMLFYPNEVCFNLSLYLFFIGNFFVLAFLLPVLKEKSNLIMCIYIPLGLILMSVITDLLKIPETQGFLTAFSIVFYGFILLTQAFLGLLILIDKNIAGLYLFIGGLMFIVSDALIMVDGTKALHTMIFYIPAEILLTLGLYKYFSSSKSFIKE